MLVRKLWRTAWSYKVQFLSMILMLAIGIGVFVGFHMEWSSIEADTGAFFQETKYADYRIYGEEGFTKEEVERIREIPGVEAATRYLSVNVGIQDTKKTLTLNVSEDYNVSTMKCMEGQPYDKEADGIWLSDRFAEENAYEIGDTMTLVYQGAEMTGKILGLCKSGENMICVADANQLMPDYQTHGFAYITGEKLEKSLGQAFYPQINLISSLEKEVLEEEVKESLGKTLQIVDKELHTAYAGAQSEAQEGKTMGAVLPVLFLAIAVLTMLTTMHRIAANEKVQMGTLKALGFRTGRILFHYASYGIFVGAVGCLAGVLLGCGIATFIMSPHGMMSTYFDLPDWSLSMPEFCIPVLLLVVVLLAWISFLSIRKMLKGTAAETLQPYAPKAMKKGRIEKGFLWNRLSFSNKWNLRDIFRHKARSFMTLFGVFGCVVLLVGGLGMKDTMMYYLKMIGEDICQYETKITVSETAEVEDAMALAEELEGDWQASMGISFQGETTTLEIYGIDHDQVRFLNKKNQLFSLADDGVYLCLRLKDKAKIGDRISISPYGREESYQVRVAGYYRSPINESMVMTDTYAKKLGISYSVSSIYTKHPTGEIPNRQLISGKQSKTAIMDSYDTFMELMDMMVWILILAAVILGIVVLYNLGIMSYVERRRELATLKVLGFRDRAIGRLLISQNIWITCVGIFLGLFGGYGVLYVLVQALASEYELYVTIQPLSYGISILLTFGVSLFVGLMVAGKNKKINMVEAMGHF